MYKVAFAGINREHHQGRINIYYNYSKDLGESFDYSTQDTSHWGETTWGEVEALPTNTQDFFFEARLRKQKCTSVCFEIESVLEDNAPTKGGAFSGVVFTLGAKRGMRKVGTNNRAKKSVT